MVKAVLPQSCWASQFNTVLLLVFGKDGVVVVLGVGGRGEEAREEKMRGKKNRCTTKPAISLYRAISIK